MSGVISTTAQFSPIATSMSSKKIVQDFSWNQVNFKAADKDILKDCWGKVKCNTTCAILGPSGAGKSSLLNVLAGRSQTSGSTSIHGKVWVGTELIDPVQYRKNIAYVMQEDSIMATATPREALTFSATMRLEDNVSQNDIVQLVNDILTKLGLDKCADTMVGGPMIKGLSGGEKKRTSVGVELITSPVLLFLDEPTSGLDSHSAQVLIETLQNIDCTILLTIHQPSSEVYHLFDQVIFMKNGMIFYAGTPDEVITYFKKFDYTVPQNYNPADFMLSVLQTTPDDVLLQKDMFMHSSVLSGTESSDTNIATTTKTNSMKSLLSWKPKDGSDTSIYSISSQVRKFFMQFNALTTREANNQFRDTGALAARFGVTIFLNILYGVIFLNAGNGDNGNTAEFQAHFGALTMILISGMFGAAQPIMLSFPFERPMFMREYSTGTYGVIPYFLAKQVVEAPLNFLTTLVQMMLAYFMIDFQGSFFALTFAIFLLGMCSCSVAVCLGASVSDVKQVTELAPLLFVPQMLFVGFFIDTQQIPKFIRWAQWLCSLKYTMNLALLTEFDADLPSCRTSQAAADNCAQVLIGNDVEADNINRGYGLYLGLLLAIYVGFRTLGAIILVKKSQQFY